MALSAVSTRWNLLAGFCAASLALGCGDSGGSKAAMDGGSDDGGGNDSEANTTGGGKPSNNTGSPMGIKVADLGDNVAGQACKGPMDCEGDGAKCETMVGGIAGMGGSPAPGGYCSGDCMADTDCGKGGVCSLYIPPLLGLTPEIAGSCQKACAKDADCRDGYICNLPANLGGASDGGAAGAANGGGMSPLPTPAVACIPKAEVATIKDQVGKACTEDSDCGTKAVCAKESIGGGFGGGTPIGESYCTGPCLEDTDCGKDGVCIGANGNNPGDCYLGCETVDTDCEREGYACILTGQFEAQGMVIQEGANACVLKPEPGGATGGEGTGGEATGGETTGGESTTGGEGTGGENTTGGEATGG